MVNRYVRVAVTILAAVCLLMVSLLLAQSLRVEAAGADNGALTDAERAPAALQSSEHVTGQLYLPVVSGGEGVSSALNNAPISTPVAAYPDGDTEPFDDEYDVTTEYFSINRAGRGPVPPPERSDTFFVTDQSTYLDRYLYRSSVPNGKLPVPILIDRFYTSQITSDSVDPNTGRLKDNVFDELVTRGLLPAEITIYLSVYDVDHNASGCPEVDYLFVNGTLLRDELDNPIKLTSGNNTWSLVSYRASTQDIKFPTSTGMTITNTVEIEIDVQCRTSWAIEVDWVALSIPTTEANRPFIFVHGWTGDGNGFGEFTRLMDEDRISYRKPLTYSNGISSTAATGAMLRDEILATVADYGVDRVNIIAHSRGGLFIREAMRSFPGVSDSIAQVFTLASPHHGIHWVRQAEPGLAKCRWTYSGVTEEQCIQAVVEMGKEWVRKYNYGEQCKKNWRGEWENCEPQYTEYLGYQAPSDIKLADAFISFVHELDIAVPLESAAYPWQVWNPMVAVPEPTIISVTQEFTFSANIQDAHGIIKENQEVYQCLMSYVDGRSNETCPDKSTVSRAQTSSTQTPPSYDTVIWTEDAQLNAGEMFTTTVDVRDSTLYFQVLSAEPVDFVLTQPDGRIIDQASAAAYPDIEYVESAYYDLPLVGFTVDNALPGIWKLSVVAPASTDAVFMLTADSELVLVAEAAEASYQVGDTAVIEGAFVQDATILIDSNAVFTGVMTFDGIAVPLTFRDDGTEGDDFGGDGIYAAQFTVPSTSGYIDVEVNATTDGLSRIAQTFIAVITQTATLDGLVSETTPDDNGNGLLDSLNVNVALQVVEEGEFVIKGRLLDANGDVIAYATTNSTELYSNPLAPGNYSVPLVFAGRAIRESGKDGPYTVDSLTVADLRNSTFAVDRSTASYSTQAYAATDFEGAAFTLTSTQEEAVDTNSDGRYDELRVQVQYQVLFAGRYNWNARLVDQDGVEVDWAQGSGMLDNSTPIELVFEGRAIGVNAMDGPYFVQDLVVFQTSGGNASTYAQKVHTTAPFRYLDFAGAMPKIEFQSRTINVVKGSGRQQIDVVLNAPLTSPATTTLRTTDGTAIAGEDYLPISTTLIIAADEMTVTVAFDVLDDGIKNGTESFLLEIGAMQGLLSGRNNPVNINILDFGAVAAISYLAVPPSLVANGVNTGTATMILLDEYGNPVEGELVSFSTNLGRVTSSSISDADGVVTATVTSGTTAGTALITAKAGSVVQSGEIRFVAGPATAASVAASTATLIADGSSTAAIIATARDAFGNVVAGQQMTFTSTLGSITTENTADVNGVATATLTTGIIVGMAEVTVTAGNATANVTIQFVAGPPATINLNVDPATLPADGASVSTVTATVVDANGNPVPDQNIAFATTLGAIPASATTDANGVATVNLTAATTTGTAQVTATAGAVVGETQVQFVAGPPASIDVSASPAAILANGSSTSAVTALVRDANGNPAPDQTVTFVTTLGAITGSSVTDADGKAAAVLTSVQQVGQAQVTVSLAELSDTTMVAFTGRVFTGSVFADINQNGEKDAGEPGITNIEVEMTLLALAAEAEQATATAVGSTWRTQSDLQGNYTFADMPFGQYRLTLYLPAGYSATTPISFTVTISEDQASAPAVGMLARIFLPAVAR